MGFLRQVYWSDTEKTARGGSRRQPLEVKENLRRHQKCIFLKLGVFASKTTRKYYMPVCIKKLEIELLHSEQAFRLNPALPVYAKTVKYPALSLSYRLSK